MATTVGGYVLEQKIGQGAMGVIWRARHPRFPGHAFALKLMAWKGDEALRTRFRQELTALERVTAHPNVVRVLGGGAEGETLYFVMELVEGQGLHKLVAREGPIEPRRAATYLRDAAAALAHVHSCDVIHRDLKPENILLGNDGRVRLADFGLAHIGGGESLTRDGAMIGTPAFAAPEQLRGHGRDRRIDVYGLGCVLWFLLHGRPPFQAADIRELMRRVKHEPPERSSVVPPAGLEAIALVAMAKKAEARYQTADELRADLDRFLAGEPIAAALPKKRRRRLLLVPLVLILGLGVAFAFALRSKAETGSAPSAPELTGEERFRALLRGKLEPAPGDVALLEAAFGTRDAATRDRLLSVALEHSAVFAGEGALGTIVAFANGRQDLRERAFRALQAAPSGAEVARCIAAADGLLATHEAVVTADARANSTRLGANAAERVVHALSRLPSALRAQTVDAILAPVWATDDGRIQGAWAETLSGLADQLAPDEVPPERAAIRILGTMDDRFDRGAAPIDPRPLERLLARLRARSPGLASGLAYRLARLERGSDERTFVSAVHHLEEGDRLAALAGEERVYYRLGFDARYAVRRLSAWPGELTLAALLEVATTPRGARLAAANCLNRHAPVPEPILARVRGTVFEAEALRQRGDLEGALAIADALESSEAWGIRALVHRAKGQAERAEADLGHMDVGESESDALIFGLERWNVGRPQR